jgi:hypothetical protein
MLRKASCADFDYGVIMSDSAANGRRVWLADTEDGEFPWTFDDKNTFIEVNESDARAKMLVYLIENHFLK